MALPSDILQQVDQVTLGYTAQAYQAVVSSHMTELRLMLIIYFAIFGIAILQGSLSLSMREITKHVLKALIIFQIATNWGTFTTFVYNVFTSGPEKLTTALSGGQNPNQQLGGVFEAGVEASRQIYQKAGTLDFSQMLLALLVFVATVVMVAAALFLLILAKMGLAILLSLAPIFIALALWKSTQGLFQGWVNYLVNYAMIPVITYALMGLILTLMQAPVNQIQQTGANLTMVDLVPFLLMGVIAVLLFFQVPRIAASLGGGITLSTMGAFARYAGGPTTMAARWGGKQLIGGASRLKSAVIAGRKNSLMSQSKALEKV